MALRSVAEKICEQRGLQMQEKVGEGAFKETFRVTDESGGDLALKVFRPDQSSARTEREIDAMQRCDHQNIAKLMVVAETVVETKRHTFIIEEYLSGGTFASRVESLGPPPNRELLDVALQLADAIGHIAGHDLVHRDIKPANILFRGEGAAPVVVDFGIVRDLGRSPLTQSWVLRGPGTPLFAAPEQLNNDRELIDWRTDQFSLGLTLFISRWKMHPFDRGNLRPDEVVNAVAEREEPAPAAVELAQEEGLEALAKMISPWPVKRYRRPEDLIRALAEAQRRIG